LVICVFDLGSRIHILIRLGLIACFFVHSMLIASCSTQLSRSSTVGLQSSKQRSALEVGNAGMSVLASRAAFIACPIDDWLSIALSNFSWISVFGIQPCSLPFPPRYQESLKRCLRTHVTSPTAKRDTHGSETLLHEELQIPSYNESIVLRSTEIVL
jgi:hypothetical protein